MLWYKSWLETRWRFLIGLVLVICSVCGIVLTYPRCSESSVARRRPRTEAFSADRSRRPWRCRASIAATSGRSGSPGTSREMLTLFAVMLGTGGLLAQARAAARSSRCPFPRPGRRLLGVRAATGLANCRCSPWFHRC